MFLIYFIFLAELEIFSSPVSFRLPVFEWNGVCSFLCVRVGGEAACERGRNRSTSGDVADKGHSATNGCTICKANTAIPYQGDQRGRTSLMRADLRLSLVPDVSVAFIDRSGTQEYIEMTVAGFSIPDLLIPVLKLLKLVKIL